MDDLENAVISFAYKGKNYKEPIVGKLVLRDMSLVEIKDKLNVLPGKFAYWKAMQVTVETEAEEAEEDYEIWHATKYQEIVDGENKKLTETAIKNLVILNNAKEYKALKMKIRGLREVVAKIAVLTKAYDMQGWSLRSVADLTGKEMGNIEAHRGKQSLKDI